MASKAGNLRARLHDRARNLGFDSCRVTQADLPETVGKGLRAYIDKGYHGTMGWLESSTGQRENPRSMWPEARSAIILGLNYGPDTDPMEGLEHKDRALISVYARNRDYHDVIKGRLKTLAGWVASATACDVKVVVDTAPLMEKPLAAQAGTGWQGKHTNLVSREFGSWLFLGIILTSAELEADQEKTDHCGSCRACLDVCPTNAFPAPYQLDARKCISYLTIEHKGPIPTAYRRPMQNRIYGCDDCLAVCPWNKFAQATREAKLVARDDLANPPLRELSLLDDVAFRKLFSGSPLKRTGRNRFIRNVLIAMGNSDETSLLPAIYVHLQDPDPVVRGAAVWALSRLETRDIFSDMRKSALARESDKQVRREWEADG